MNIAIIGGGASGLCLARLLNTTNHQVDLYEKNNIFGKKLLITGKGRCNVLNHTTPEIFLEKVKRGKDFFKSTIFSYSPEHIYQYFVRNGLELKTERGNRVFPVSDKSSDVVDFFVSSLKKTKIYLNEKVKEIHPDLTLITDKQKKKYDYIVVCTGGLTYPKTGSTGDGYKFANKLGIKILKPKGTLIPVITKEDVSSLEGISLKNVEVKAMKNGKIIFKDFGEMLFTKNGLSGPLIISMSSCLLNENEYIICVDLKPSLDIPTLEKRILRDFNERKKQNISNGIRGLIIDRLSNYILERSKINLDKKVNLITKEERKTLIQNIKTLTFSFKEYECDDQGIITAGGVDTRELYPTFESKKIQNLYFIGEVVNIDALTGGYNLQIAFSSAFKAYDDIMKKTARGVKC